MFRTGHVVSTLPGEPSHVGHTAGLLHVVEVDAGLVRRCLCRHDGCPGSLGSSRVPHPLVGEVCCRLPRRQVPRAWWLGVVHLMSGCGRLVGVLSLARGGPVHGSVCRLVVARYHA